MVFFVLLFLFLFLLADFSICLETEHEVGWISKWAGLEKRHCSKEKKCSKKKTSLHSLGNLKGLVLILIS